MSALSRRSFLGLVGASTAALLAACASSPSSQPSSSSSSSSSSSDATAASDQRIVVLNTGQLDNMLELGILPVGAAKAKNGKVIEDYLRVAYGENFDLDSIADCGVRANPDLEAIALLQPTLICANDRTDESILTQLKAIAPVVTGSGGGENWREDFLTIAQAVGLEEKAQQLLSDFEADCTAFADSFDAESPAPTVSFLRTKDDAFQLYGTNSMAGSIATLCGLQRPESHQFTEKAGKDLSVEQLSEADADWLFYGVQAGATDPASTPAWATLTSVKNDQAIAVDYESWYMNASYYSATIIRDGLKQHLGA